MGSPHIPLDFLSPRILIMRECVPSAHLALAASLALSGCAVGLNFKPATRPAIGSYVGEAMPAETAATDVPGGAAQRFQFGRDLSGQWWTLFGSSKLDAMIEEAMINYPDIAAQQAALRAAGENVRAEMGVFSPQIQGTGNASRVKESGASIGPGFPGFITNIFQATVNVSYTFDVFGGERRTLEGLQAQEQAQNFQLEASYLTLTSNVVSTVIQLASVTDQIAATQEIIALETNELGIVRRRSELGSQTRADVLQQESNLALVRATLPALEQQRAAAEHQLATLTGHFPNDATPAEITLSDLILPRDLPISLPSSLVAQRPDIKAREAQMHEASAAIGIATANMLPQFTLTGSVGNESLLLRSWFQPSAAVWSLAAGITQPIFEGGALRAKRRAAIDLYDQAGAQYRLAVLKAFQNVADTLTALDHDAQALKAEYDALNAVKASLDLTQKQYAVGSINYNSLLTAQQAYQQSRLAYVQAAANRYTDTVTLFQALGGGWWNRRDPGTLQEASPDQRLAKAQEK
jgi:NodT family efflux transporter outer membrane factor (OMF) lipoprotein